jgi:hypothetical protein
VTRRLAETALADAKKYWRDDNYRIGHRVLIEWIEEEGENISNLLLYRKRSSAPVLRELMAVG